MELHSLIRTRTSERISPENAKNLLITTPALAPHTSRSQLARVVNGFAKVLNRRGHRVTVLAPWYENLELTGIKPSQRATELKVPRQGKNQNQVDAQLYEADRRGLRLLFVDQSEFFNTSNASQVTSPASAFSFFSRAAVEFLRQTSNDIETVLCEGWESALLPIYLSHYYDEELAHIQTSFRQHQSLEASRFSKESLEKTGLPKSYYNKNKLRVDDDINFAKGAIQVSDRVTFNSEAYHQALTESATEESARTLLENHNSKTSVIPDCIDGETWSPKHDAQLDYNFSADEVTRKRLNKPGLQKQVDLPVFSEIPLFVFNAATADRTSAEMVRDVFEDKLSDNSNASFQLIWLDRKEGYLSDSLESLTDKYPGNIGLISDPNEVDLRRALAGADALVRPEPAFSFNLSHLVAMQYGTIVVGHETGLISDSIQDLSDYLEVGSYQIPEFDRSRLQGEGLGFLYQSFSKDELQGAVERAMTTYRDYANWVAIVEKNMQLDFTWKRAIAAIEKVFEEETNLDEAV